MSSASILWGAAGLAAVLPLIRIVFLHKQWLPPRILNAVLTRSCYEGKWDRARKLCRAGMPDSPYCAALEEVFKSISGLPQEGGVRTIVTPLATVFEEAYAAQAPRFFALRWLSFLAAALLVVPPIQWHAVVRDMAKPQTYLILLLVGALLIAIAEYFATFMHGTYKQSGASLMAQLSNAVMRIPETAPAPPTPMPTTPLQPISASAAASPAPIVLHIYRDATFLEEARFAGPMIKIGKLSSAAIGADEQSLSRMHALIELGSGGSAQLLDLGSIGGTFLNGEKVAKGDLHVGDEIRVGALRLVVKKLSPP
jgi:hypothetical protein